MISQLIENIKKTKAPICVGLDPMLSYVPEHVVKKAFDAYGAVSYTHLTLPTIA